MEYILGGPALDQTVGRLVIAPHVIDVGMDWRCGGASNITDPGQTQPDCGPDLLTSGLMGGSSQWLMAIR